jgi:hypothetical protein
MLGNRLQGIGPLCLVIEEISKYDFKDGSKGESAEILQDKDPKQARIVQGLVDKHEAEA